MVLPEGIILHSRHPGPVLYPEFIFDLFIIDLTLILAVLVDHPAHGSSGISDQGVIDHSFPVFGQELLPVALRHFLYDRFHTVIVHLHFVVYKRDHGQESVQPARRQRAVFKTAIGNPVKLVLGLHPAGPFCVDDLLIREDRRNPLGDIRIGVRTVDRSAQYIVLCDLHARDAQEGRHVSEVKIGLSAILDRPPCGIELVIKKDIPGVGIRRGLLFEYLSHFRERADKARLRRGELSKVRDREGGFLALALPVLIEIVEVVDNDLSQFIGVHRRVFPELVEPSGIVLRRSRFRFGGRDVVVGIIRKDKAELDASHQAGIDIYEIEPAVLLPVAIRVHSFIVRERVHEAVK